MGIEVVIPGVDGIAMNIQIQSSMVDRIKEAQEKDTEIRGLKAHVAAGLINRLLVHEDGSLRLGNRLCVPQ